MNAVKYFFLSLTFLALSHSTLAQEAIITDRPSQSDGSFVLPATLFQIETGLNYNAATLPDPSSFSVNIFTFGSLFRLGLLDGLELRLITAPTNLQVRSAAEVVESRTGMQDLQVGFKLRLLDTKNSNPTSISLLAHLIAPTGSEGFSRVKPEL